MSNIRPRRILTAPHAALLLLMTVAFPLSASAAQSSAPEPPPIDPLEALVAEVVAGHPEITAAGSRIDAAVARVPQAGALPDPTLSVGLMNLPLPDLDPSMEGMTMFSIEAMQRLPPRGLRAALSRATEARVEVARAEVEVVRLDLARRVKEAYFELLLVTGALEVHHRTVAALEAFAASAEAAYSEGIAPQQDMLRAQTELAAIEEHMAEMRQRRGTALSELNTLLGRELRSPLTPEIPHHVVRLLEADPGSGMLSTFPSHAELGPGFPTLATLEAMAMEHRPELRLAEHRIDAARHEAEAARRDRRPGIALMGGYGIRSSRPDLVSLGVSMDLPVFRGRKQEQALVEAEHAMEAESRTEEAVRRSVQREVGEAHAGLLEVREQVILLEEAVIPQARAAAQSAAAAYRTGDGDFVRLMEAQTVLFRHEIRLAHLVAGLGGQLARLERAVGTDIRPEDNR